MRRDLYNAQDSQGQNTLTQDNITHYFKQLSNISSSIITNVTILNSEEFVQYPSDSDVEAFASAYYPNLSMDKKAVKEYLSGLQKKMSVTTKVLQATIQYTGFERNYTVVIKQYSISNSTAPYSIVEDIGKSSAFNIASTILPPDSNLKDMSKKGNFILVGSLENNGTYSYYKESLGSISQSGIPEQFLIEKNPRVQSYSSSGLTGFVTYTFSSTKSALFSILAILVIAMLGYGIYSGKAVQLISGGSSESAESARIIRRALDDMSLHIRSEDYDEAFLNYEEAALQYGKLSERQEPIFRQDISASYLKLLSAKGTRDIQALSSTLKKLKVMDAEDYSYLMPHPQRQPYTARGSYDVKQMKKDFSEKASDLKRQYRSLMKAKSMLKEARDLKKTLSSSRNVSSAEIMQALDHYNEFAREFERASEKFSDKYQELKSEFKTIRHITRSS